MIQFLGEIRNSIMNKIWSIIPWDLINALKYPISQRALFIHSATESCWHRFFLATWTPLWGGAPCNFQGVQLNVFSFDGGFNHMSHTVYDLKQNLMAKRMVFVLHGLEQLLPSYRPFVLMCYFSSEWLLLLCSFWPYSLALGWIPYYISSLMMWITYPQELHFKSHSTLFKKCIFGPIFWTTQV